MSAAAQMMPPQPLTAGMPDPATIAKQKDAYMKMLDEQVKQGTQVLEAQVKHQKGYLLGQADQQKKQFIMQIDMEVKQQEMALVRIFFDRDSTRFLNLLMYFKIYTCDINDIIRN